MNHPSDRNPPSLMDFSKDALHDILHFDVKFIKSLKLLIFRPGYLTVQAATPEQNNYVKPLGLFIFLNFIFFLLKSKGLFHYRLDMYDSIRFFQPEIASKLASSHLSREIFDERFNTAMKFEQREYIIVMIPLFALFVTLLYLNKKFSYLQHLVFSIHYYSFIVLFLMVFPYVAIAIGVVMQLTNHKPFFLYSEYPLDILVFSLTGLYLFIALKKVYKQSFALTFLKTTVLTLSFYLLIVFVYRTILFYIVMHSIDA